MASFRKGFKIFGEISIKQGLGRIRSFSEDRKPGRWLPEDQWAVRQPNESTCPDPCKPKKPQKPSKSWLSVCKDPETPIPCDIRHNNCPPPPPPKEGPWYSLDNLMPKRKTEKPPSLESCREEAKRREAEGIEEVCETNKRKPKLQFEIDEDVCSMPKMGPCPAPVVTMSCPLPKELDIMLWCGRPSKDTSRIAMQCQSDRLPYEEFKPQKRWKPPPFSLPCKSDPIPIPSFNRGSIAYAEFKQVEVPKPLYTRYKSVELCDQDFLLCSIEVQCPEDYETCCAPETPSICSCCPPPTCPAPCPSTPPPCRRPCVPPCCRKRPPPQPEPQPEPLPEKRVIVAAGGKPVKIRKAPKCTFRPKLTKLVERRSLRNPLASCECSESRTEETNENDEYSRCREDEEPPKVITGTLTDEPQVYERDFCVNNPPSWMYVLCKPGCKDTPLLPKSYDLPDEPDWSSETDGLNFYDDNNENIRPKPPPDPFIMEAKQEEKPVFAVPPVLEKRTPVKFKSRIVLMPEEYNIKYSRPEEPPEQMENEQATFDEFIQAKTHSSKPLPKSYPPMKENILYDLQRLCPRAPCDPSKLNTPCLNPVPNPCMPRFFRCFSTLIRPRAVSLKSVQLQKLQQRTDCGDSSQKCKVRKLVPKSKDCTEEKPKISDNLEKAGVVKSLKLQAKEAYASTVKCQTIKPKHNVALNNKVVLGLNDDRSCDYEQRSVVVKQKKKAIPVVPIDNQFLNKEIVDVQMTGLTMPEMNLKSEEILESEEMEENFVTISNPPVGDKDIPKDFMGSIGSWINDLFNEFVAAPPKRPATANPPQSNKKQEKYNEIDEKFMESLSVLKEKLKKKLKNETTIHLSTGDRALNFEKLTDKKNKKKSNWVSPSEQNLSGADSKMAHDQNPPVHRFPIKINEKENIYITVQSEDRDELNNSFFVKTKEKFPLKERSKKRKPEEQFFISPQELPRNLQLNVNDLEKLTQLYKNTPFGVQEPQSYNQRRAKSYQHIARCYTTNANLIENAKSSLMPVTRNKRSVVHLNSCSEANECLTPKKNSKLKKNPPPESTKEWLMLDKDKSSKSFHKPLESSKTEPKTQSVDLVKHLIKKTKMSSRPQSFKKKTKTTTAVTTPKPRFMQSATNSLVTTVMAKKETDILLTLKSGNRFSPDNKIIKSERVNNELAAKHRDIRFEMKNFVAPRFTKSSLINNVSDTTNNSQSSSITGLKPDLWYGTKDVSKKSKKGLDIKQILTKLDKRHESLRSKQELDKEQNGEQTESQEAQNARFQKQHELFRNGLKTPQQSESYNGNEGYENKATGNFDSSNNAGDFVLFDPKTQSVSEKFSEGQKYDLPEFGQALAVTRPEETDFSPICGSFDNAKDEILDSLNSPKMSPKSEKNEAPEMNGNLVKTKSLQYLKAEDTKDLINPLTPLCNSEPQNQKGNYERQLPSSEIRPQKALEPVLLNRAYSTNILERNYKTDKLLPIKEPRNVLMFSDDKKSSKKKIPGKKKDKTLKPVDEKDHNKERCESDHPKKPGPNCDKSDLE